MKKTFLLIGLAVAFASQAADYILDFRAATPVASEAPVLRRTEMPLAVGQIPSVAVGDTITLTLFDDVAFALKVVSAPPAGIAGQSFIAKDENGSASAIVKVTAKAARISVDDFMNRRQYTVRCKDGKVLIVEHDNSQEKGGECGTCSGEIEVPQPVVEETTTTSVKKSRKLLGASGNEFPLAEQKSVVDILVAFDKGAKVWAENGNNWKDDNDNVIGNTIEEFADYAVNKMNSVLVNSQLDDKLCYRLAGVTEIDDQWDEIDKNSILLNAVRTRSGALAKLATMRERCGADTITLLINRTKGTTSGVGYEYSQFNRVEKLDDGSSVTNTYTYTAAQFDGMNYACNVCDINTVYSRYTMSHEIGHNMGCGHSNRQGTSSGPGRYSDSCGYHFEDKGGSKRYTIMAYDHTSPASGTYSPVPYFSTPNISPSEYGCALGVEGINNNRGTLLQTHADIAGLREHVLPYDWDVRFFGSDGKEIEDGCYMPYGKHSITLIHEDTTADIYYTLDGSTPNTSTKTKVKSGESIDVTIYDQMIITACAVVGGTAQSVRSITIKEGLYWSGEEGLDGNGIWADDTSVLAWNNYTTYYDKWTTSVFPDISDASSTVVTVKGTVSPYLVSFLALETAYTFNKYDDSALIKLHDSSFAPSGDLTFNVPVSLEATSFTIPASHALSFNAPFGTNVAAGATSGYCTNAIVLNNYSELVVAPGNGKTQSFKNFDTSDSSYYITQAKFRVGEGTVVFDGPFDTSYGCLGNAQIVVSNGGNLVFNNAAATGAYMTSPFTVEKGGTVTFNGSMEHMQRPLYLAGGTLVCNSRFDKMRAYGTAVTDDSEIRGNGYILLRHNNETINVATDKTLTLNVPIQNNEGANTKGIGFIKTGDGTIVANKELKHSGATTIQAGALTVGYSATGRYGTGWSVANGAKLKINSGCSLSVPNLTLTSGATLSVPTSSSAPLTATNAVSVAGVAFELTGMEGTSNAIYPLLHADGGITGVESIDTSRLPVLSGGSEWSLEVKDNTLYARSFTIAPAEGIVPLVSNVSGISLSMPDDATVNADGGATIDSSPIVISPLDTKKVAITARIVIPTNTLSEVSTLCSWMVGDFVIYCVCETNGELNCRWIQTDGSSQTVGNQKSGFKLSAGEHVLQIEYYSHATADDKGTQVLIDGALVYRANGLRFTDYSVNSIAFGATAEDSPRFEYPGLVVREAIVIDTLSSAPAQVVSGRLPTVDVLVAYDQGAQTYVANKNETLEAFAQAQIERMNAVLATNRLDRYYLYRLAGVCKVDGTYNDINTAPATISEGTGAAVSLRAAREHYGADTVTLLVDTTGNTLGNSSPLSYTTGVANQHENAFSVCSISAVDTGMQHTMIHENAHNMGCGHARAHDHCSPFDYGYGFYFKDGNVTRHTIMAYGTDANASWYFSTSSSEFGLTLGDATNDNARVLRETCGEVAKWRESVLPYGDDVIVKVAGSGEEVLPGRVFANSIKLELSAPDGVEDATIYYTLDGSAPTLESSIYSSPFEVTETTSLSLRYVSGTTVSPVRTVKLFRIDALADAGDVTWYTSVKYPWADDGDGVVRSCNHTNYNYYCTTPLRAKVVGPKTLRFKQKTYFFTPKEEESTWSHFDVLVDDKVVVATNYCDTVWSGDVEVSIQDEGEHDIQFVYSQRNARNKPDNGKYGAPVMDDAVWLKDIRFLDPTTYEVREGETIAYSALPEGTTRVVGMGTVNCCATLPASLGWTESTWKGTVTFNGLSGGNYNDFQFELFGNAKSKIQLKNCSIPYLKNNNATFAGTVVLDGDGTAFSTSNGYSGWFNVFGALEGEGSMSFTANPTQAYVFNTATNFTGSITINADNSTGGRKIVFGEVASAEDLPSQVGSITVKSGATASIGGGATWNAYNGVEIAGTLLVKGACATLDCNDSGALGIKLDGGATIRFESNDANIVFAKKFKFDSGTVNIKLGDGVTPTKRKLITWPSKPTGNFNLVGYDGKWVLVVEDDGLSLAKWKPDEDERYDIPGTDAYIAESYALSNWLDENNFELYYGDSMTWQAFMGESGANGYPNWQNFLLGYSAEDPTQKFTAKIEIVNGEVKITTTEGTIPDGCGVVKRLFKKTALDADWDPPEGVIMDDKTLEMPAGDSGFYKVEVSIESE